MEQKVKQIDPTHMVGSLVAALGQLIHDFELPFNMVIGALEAQTIYLKYPNETKWPTDAKKTIDVLEEENEVVEQNQTEPTSSVEVG